ncbi:CDP-diacylglycerol--serine O-phosphatidyltransferase [Paraferrimonas sp. SM1919]|uniref:CDP-diacylglycerol--serine O-phosphatidyltransferase n=1 Tax=Paraferrimonas sp. SM1919 TaxID=2662263 RepID=UPI0013CFD192|nr:CDP-diacylglycerol--serine O-phosphatidyltransferase [Paraferrimonas sp. SM1919]
MVLSAQKLEIKTLAGFPLEGDQMQWIQDAKQMHQTLLSQIKHAKYRIYLVCLYLQDDEAGREVFQALIAAKKSNPDLDIKLFVDYHRAQRGLIGEGEARGNNVMYREALAAAGVQFGVYGVPVKSREVMGVLHLKGFVFDDTVLYSGASINNVYMHYFDKYRIDRYYLIHNLSLADSFSQFINQHLLQDKNLQNLCSESKKPKKIINHFIRHYKKQLSAAQYDNGTKTSGLRVTPLSGLGLRANKLNKVTLQLVRGIEDHAFICTPYFNPPLALMRAIGAKLRQGKKIDIVVGDKTANDFYIPPSEEFNIIGALPYLYEQSLRRFVKRFQWAIDAQLLRVHLWHDANNSYHLKGISADNNKHLITGSNLNPRAWSLDVENGLMINDPQQLWSQQFSNEQQQILANTKMVNHYRQLDKIDTYPKDAQKVVNRIRRFRAEFLLKRIL